MPHSANFILALPLLTLAGCNTPPTAPPPPASALPSLTTTDPDFAAANSILRGFELADSPDDWQIGDQALLALRLTKPNSITVRFLLIELSEHIDPATVAIPSGGSGRSTQKFESPICFNRLTLYDQDGNVLNTGRGRFPQRMLGAGIYDDTEPHIGRVRAPDDEAEFAGLSEQQTQSRLNGRRSLATFSMALGRKGMLRDMTKDIAALPNLLTLLLRPTITVNMGESGEIERQPWSPSPAITLDAITTPVICSIGGQPSIVARIHAARPLAPLSLTSGIVSIVGNNAEKPENRFEMRLLATKRGSGGREFVATEKISSP